MPDDNKLLAPLEGPPDPDAPFTTVKCSTPGCRVSFFISKQDPALPDGPFFCDFCRDMPSTVKTPDSVVVTLICDRCDAQLIVEAQTREAALAQLNTLVQERNWLYVNRLEEAIEIPSTKDLCGDCRKTL